MRGAQTATAAATVSTRIIPADAGSTTTVLAVWSETRDHPRGCGEHESPSRLFFSSTGSSPRMRGALNLAGLLVDYFRIIPADAGSTCIRQ